MSPMTQSVWNYRLNVCIGIRYLPSDRNSSSVLGLLDTQRRGCIPLNYVHTYAVNVSMLLGGLDKREQSYIIQSTTAY